MFILKITKLTFYHCRPWPSWHQGRLPWSWLRLRFSYFQPIESPRPENQLAKQEERTNPLKDGFAILQFLDLFESGGKIGALFEKFLCQFVFLNGPSQPFHSGQFAPL